MSDFDPEESFLIEKGILIGGGVTGIVELLPDGNVIKTPWPDERAPMSQKDIRIEAQAYQRIAERFDAHIRFVKLIAFDQKQHTLTMEYMGKGTLHDYLETNSQSITLHQRHLWIKAMAEGLDLLHSAAIIHCDLTPKNLLLDDGLELKIADFGCCSIDNSINTGGNNTRFYPSRASSTSPVSFDDDLFALGSCIYQVLTGVSPFEDIASPQVQTLKRLRQFPDLTGVEFAHIVRDCWLRQADSARSVYSRVLQSLQDHSS